MKVRNLSENSLLHRHRLLSATPVAVATVLLAFAAALSFAAMVALSGGASEVAADEGVPAKHRKEAPSEQPEGTPLGVAVDQANPFTGSISGWPESGAIFLFDQQVSVFSGIEAWWSINTLNPDRGWFYGYNASTFVAHVTGITAVDEITDASTYNYTDWSVGPVDEGDIVLFHSTTTGYYAAFRVDDIYGDAALNTFANITWYFQSDGTADFSSSAPLAAEFSVSPTLSQENGIIKTTSPDPFLNIAFNQAVTLTQLALDGLDILSNTSTGDNRTFIYPARNLFIGDHTIAVTAKNAAGTNASFEWTFSVIGEPRFQIPMKPGWNLISLPSTPVDPDVNAVFAAPTSTDMVVTASGFTSGSLRLPCNPLDTSSFGPGCQVAVRSGNGQFSGTLSRIDAGRAYWVRSISFQPIWVDLPGLQGGTATLPLVTHVDPGYNLVGVLSFDQGASFGDAVPADEYFSGVPWQRAYEYDPALNQFAQILPGAGGQLSIGKGYYVYVSEPGVLLPASSLPVAVSKGATVSTTQAVVPMQPGWNFVSLPGPPVDSAINAVIPPSAPIATVLTYDPTLPGGWLVALRDETGQFVGTLTTVEDGRGYWMQSTAFADLLVDLAPAPEPRYTFSKGWNAFGITVVDPSALTDMDGDGQAAELPIDTYMPSMPWKGVYAYDAATGAMHGVLPGSPVSTRYLKIGQGYWVYTAFEGVYAPFKKPILVAPATPRPPVENAVISDHKFLSDAITYTMVDLPQPSPGMELVGWLVSNDGSIKLNTGPMGVQPDGSVIHVFDSIDPRYTAENLVHAYDTVVITEETAGANPDAPAGPPVYAHQIPAGAMAHIRHLITSWPPGSNSGILTNLKNQLGLSLEVAHLARNSTTTAGLRKWSEVLINAIEGPEGPNYGDLNGDGTVEDFGDGVGVLTHATDRKHAGFAAGAAPDDQLIVFHAKRVEIDGANLEDWASQARDLGLLSLQQADLTMAQLLIANALGLLEAALLGRDADGNGTIESVTGEGGAAQAYVEAQLIASYHLDSVPAPPEPPVPPGLQLATLKVRAYVDGRSRLVLQGNSARWHHLDFAGPGRWIDADEPTYLNGAPWFPAWPDVPDRENRDCNCDSSHYVGVPFLAAEAHTVGLAIVQARGGATVIQQPAQANGFTLIVEFDDNPPFGADWYDVKLDYLAPLLPASLLSVSPHDDQLRVVDPYSGATLGQTTITLPGRTVLGGAGAGYRPHHRRAMGPAEAVRPGRSGAGCNRPSDRGGHQQRRHRQ